MKLIKCSHCGRPYYDSESKCIYCGTPTSQSANNFVKQAISSPQSHQHMVDVLSGNYTAATTAEEIPQQPETPIAAAPTEEPAVMDTKESIDETAAIVEETAEAVTAVETVMENTPNNLSDAVKERAEAIADATTSVNEASNDNDTPIPNVEEIETTPRKKRRGWIWILVILVILLGIAAVVYLKWDAINELIAKIMG